MYSNSCGIVCVAKRQNSKETPCGKEKTQMKTITEITRQKPAPPQIRLAAYCRVSSDSSDQLHSFAAQIKYYSEYCKRHPEYKFVDIYADEYNEKTIQCYGVSTPHKHKKTALRVENHSGSRLFCVYRASFLLEGCTLFAYTPCLCAYTPCVHSCWGFVYPLGQS